MVSVSFTTAKFLATAAVSSASPICHTPACNVWAPYLLVVTARNKVASSDVCSL
jgi:hypothetical protein